MNNAIVNVPLPNLVTRGDLYAVCAKRTITAVGETVTDETLVASNHDLLIRHLDIQAFHTGGAIVEEAADQDEILIQVTDNPTSTQWFSQAIPLFALRRFSLGLRFAPIFVGRQTQLTVTVQHTTLTSGSYHYTPDINVYLTLFGQKIAPGSLTQYLNR